MADGQKLASYAQLIDLAQRLGAGGSEPSEHQAAIELAQALAALAKTHRLQLDLAAPQRSGLAALR